MSSNFPFPVRFKFSISFPLHLSVFLPVKKVKGSEGRAALRAGESHETVMPLPGWVSLEADDSEKYGEDGIDNDLASGRASEPVTVLRSSAVSS